MQAEHCATSALYTGTLAHRRRSVVPHEFRYRVALLFLDLAELPDRGLAPLWACNRRAPISFRREEYFGDPRVPLDGSIRDLVESRTGERPAGPVFLLTSPRVLGYSFNPLSLYYCYDAAGRFVEHVVAEVTNTPWRKRHCYVLSVASHDRGTRVHRFVTPKELHVSPFFGMSQQYRWRMTMPGEQLELSIANEEGGRCVFDASLCLEREPLNRTTLVRSTLIDAPFGALRTTAAIHFEALRLWWKGARYHPYPHHSHADRVPLANTEASHAGERCRAA